ncbi:MAG: WD40 repeat domain-containing protein, partial [Ginsengibacter sp.]
MNNDRLFQCHRGPVTCAVEIPNSSSIITSGYDCAVAVFNRATRKAKLLGYHQHLVNKVAVNAGGTLAATASSDYNICIWDLRKEELYKVLRGHSDDVEDFVFIDSDMGASVSRDRRIIVWNLESGAIKRIIYGHEKDVLSVNYFEGKLYTSGDDMTLRVWDINTGKEISRFGPYETETDTCAIDQVNRRIVLGCDDGIVRIFNIDTSEAVQQLSGHVSAIKKVAVSPLNGDILSAAYDQRILIWDSRDNNMKQKLVPKSGLWERSFNWTPDGKRVTAGTFDGTVLIWDVATGECIDELGVVLKQKGNCCFNDIASMENHRVVTVSDDGLIRIGELTEHSANWITSFYPNAGRTLMNAITYDSANKQIIVGTHEQNI